MRARDAVIAAQRALRLVPEILYAVDMVIPAVRRSDSFVIMSDTLAGDS